MTQFSPAWRKSTRSNSQNACVEAAVMEDGNLAFSDSKTVGFPGGRQVLSGISQRDFLAVLSLAKRSR